MKKISLGKSDIKISPLIFGGNVFGWTVNEKTAFELLNEFYENGFNCVDTADIYSMWVPGNSGGESETIIGKWLKYSGKRKDMVIATKVGYAKAGGKNNLSRKYILESVDNSLRRLQTDYIDLYQSHVDDLETDIEETLEAYNELIVAGKVRAIGCSNFSVERLAESIQISKEKKINAYQTLQPEYNLYDRDIYEKDLQKFCVENKISVIPFFPLAAGFLSGKYRSEKDAEGKARGGRAKKYLNEKGFRILDALDKISRDYNSTPAEISLAWILKQPGIAAPISSSTNLSQLKSLMKSVSIELSKDAIEILNEASSE